jgi:hypothetical protein
MGVRWGRMCGARVFPAQLILHRIPDWVVPYLRFRCFVNTSGSVVGISQFHHDKVGRFYTSMLFSLDIR